MPKLIDKPTVIEAAGNKPKKIEEFIGNVNTETSELSVAKMTSPQGNIDQVKLSVNPLDSQVYVWIPPLTSL